MLEKRPEVLLRACHVWERSTDRIGFQWKARLLQAMWRESLGLAPAEYSGKLRGAQIPMPQAKESLANYLSPNIRALVQREVDDPIRAKGKLYKKPRIYNNLLSSQPLCFNLFGELSLDLDLATRVLSDFTGGQVAQVHAIEFEFSPGRGDDRYTGDKSAYDVYVRYENQDRKACFLGIEVKYHEGLYDKEAEYRPRYDELIEAMGCFDPDALGRIKKRPLEQIMRDHLLVGAHRLVDGFAEGTFVFLYPEGNANCASAVQAYKECLSDASSFVSWTLEDLVATLMRHSSAQWVEAFYNRYLDFTKISERVDPST